MAATDAEIPVGAGTTLASQSAGAAPIFGRNIPSENAKLYLGCIQKALHDPLPVEQLSHLPAMTVDRQRELLFQCRQKVPSLDFAFCVGGLFLFFLISSVTNVGIGVAVGL